MEKGCSLHDAVSKRSTQRVQPDKGQAMFIYPREHHYQAVYLQQDMVLVQMAAMQEAEQQDVELFLLMPNDEQ
ncbi:hypothetical protein WJX79_000708 [Trebouxia sp. C0005]